MFSKGYLFGFLIVIPYWYFVLYRPKKKHIESRIDSKRMQILQHLARKIEKKRKEFRRHKKSEDVIGVTPKKYRKIILHFIKSIESPVVKYNRKVITDFSEQGLLTQQGIRNCRDFEIFSKREKVIGFHDHPNEMWIVNSHLELAQHCEKEGWLKIERINNSPHD